MYIGRSDQDALVAQEPASDRYRHIKFLSKMDFAAPPRSRTPPRRRSVGPPGTAPSREEALDPEARRFLQLVLDGAGVDPDCYRGAPLVRRLQACLRCLHARSVAEAWERLQREPNRLAEAASALLIGVTQFFRDAQVFSYLDEAVLPKLSTGRADMSVWSVGCADGAELYSMAMLLAERGLFEGTRLLGTDCRADAIGQAQRGWFDRTRLESLDERLRQTYFVPRKRGWQVCNALRGATVWQQGNALVGPINTDGVWDLILCRNLAMYLEPAAAAQLWTTLTHSLRIGGVLVVGKAERPEQPLCLARLAPCVFERQG